MSLPTKSVSLLLTADGSGDHPVDTVVHKPECLCSECLGSLFGHSGGGLAG